MLQNIYYLEIQDFNSDGSLKSYVNNGKPALLMAQGDYCGYCKQAKPAIQKFANENKNITVCTLLIDGSKSEQEAAKFLKHWDPSYIGVPTFVGFNSNGKFNSIHSLGRDVRAHIQYCSTLR